MLPVAAVPLRELGHEGGMEVNDNIAAFLAEQKRLADAATKGPWDSYRPNPAYRIYEVCSTTPQGLNETLAEVSGYNASNDVEFTVAARSSHPRMVKALEAVLNHATKQRDEIRTSFKETGAAPARELGYADACDDVIAFITAALEGEETNE